MKLEDFVKKYIGVKVDFDNYAGPQCVDLFRQYVKEGLDIPEHTGVCGTSGGAKDLYLDYNKMPKEQKYFKRGKVGLKAGDILIWDKTDTNKYGHVAIYLRKFGDYLEVFEQDGFKQDGAKINLRTNKNFLGYLRKK